MQAKTFVRILLDVSPMHQFLIPARSALFWATISTSVCGTYWIFYDNLPFGSLPSGFLLLPFEFYADLIEVPLGTNQGLVFLILQTGLTFLTFFFIVFLVAAIRINHGDPYLPNQLEP